MADENAKVTDFYEKEDSVKSGKRGRAQTSTSSITPESKKPTLDDSDIDLASLTGLPPWGTILLRMMKKMMAQIEKVSVKMDTFAQTYEKRIEQVEVSLEAKISESETRIESKFNEENTKIAADILELKESMQMTNDDHLNRIAALEKTKNTLKT